MIERFIDKAKESEETEMKKNIEWLKERVENHIEPYEEEDYLSYSAGCTDVAEIILGLIVQLDEPETLSPEWISKMTSPVDNEGRLYVWKNDLENLLVPKQVIKEEQALRKIVEKYPLTPNDIPWILDRYVANVLVEQPKKPVIPSYVADLMEDYNDASIHSFLSDAFRNYREGRADRADTWITKNPADFVDAYRYGYTVEEEPKYEVRCKGELLLTYYTNIGEVVSMNRWDNHLSKKAGRDWKLRHELTEQEIKDYDERYWPFAIPVEDNQKTRRSEHYYYISRNDRCRKNDLYRKAGKGTRHQGVL